VNSPSSKSSSTTRRISWSNLLDQLAPLIGLAATYGLFAALKGYDFYKWENTQLLMLHTAVVGIAALGATMIIVSGGIDLSVGSNIALVSVVIALMLKQGFSPVIAALTGVATGGLVGLAIGSMVVGHVGRVAAVVFGGLTIIWTWNYGWYAALPLGAVVFAALLAGNELGLGRLRLAPFIVTLGLWSALRGVAKGLADNKAIYPPSSWLNDLMKIPGGDSAWMQLSPGVWLFIFLSILMAAALRYTRFGRHVFAIGSNEQTARLCGIHVERTKVMIYVVALLLAGIAGVLQFSKLTIGDPNTAKVYELKVIAAVVIGGASLTGGVGTIRGTVIGALIMTVVDNGCTKVGMENWVQEIITGGIIVAAVALDQLRHRRVT
jgi:ribose/xylose/arabinose/galactoside ABC-type transport system permease subunit